MITFLQPLQLPLAVEVHPYRKNAGGGFSVSWGKKSWENYKNSNFKDTKIKIIDKDSEAVYLDMIYEEFIAPGYLDNCYINDELIINKSKQRQR